MKNIIQYKNKCNTLKHNISLEKDNNLTPEKDRQESQQLQKKKIAALKNVKGLQLVQIDRV